MKSVDSYIKDRASKFEVEFDESYWEAAEALIVAENARKRKRRIAFFFSAVVLAGLMGLAGIYTIDQRPNKDGSNVNVVEKIESTNNSTGDEVSGNADQLSSVNEMKNENELPAANSKAASVIKAKNTSRKKKAKNKSVTTSEEISSDTLNQVYTENTALQNIPAKLGAITAPLGFYDIMERNDYADVFKTKPRAFLMLQFGTNINEKLGFGYFANMQYLHELGRKHSVSAGFGINTIDAPYLKYQFSEVDYSFSEQITNVTVSTKQLGYIEIPIQYRYRIHKAHHATLGVGYQYLLGQRNEIVREEWNDETSTSYETGKSSDFRNYDVALNLGYENVYFNRYRIGVAWQQSLVNPMQNTTKEKQAFQLYNSEFRVYALMNIYKFK